MAFETVYLLRIVEFVAEGTGDMSISIFSDLPGNQMTLRENKTMPLWVTVGRRTVRFRLAGTTKGKLFRFQVTGSGVVRLYGARVYAKALGSTAADWNWYALPVEQTPDEWTAIPLPIEPSEEGWTAVPLPIDPTSDEWLKIPLPIPKTPDEQIWKEIPVAL